MRPHFATRSGGRMAVNGLRHVLEGRFKAVGLPFHGVHGFRRGWAIAMLDNGENVLNLKELAGWSTLEMCYRYTRATAQDRALVQYESPMDRLNGRRGK